MEFIIPIISAIIAAALGFFFAQRRVGDVNARNELLTKQHEELKTAFAQSETKRNTAENERSALLAQSARFEAEAIALKDSLEKEKQQHTSIVSELKSEHEKRLAEQRLQQREQLNEQLKLLTEQMKSTTERVLKQRSDELSNSNKEQLASILTPLQENIKQMKEAVEKSDREQTVTMERLDVAIKENLKRAQEVGERADKLAQALTGDNKKQGDFGEFKLEMMLQDMGLEQGLQYDTQVSFNDKDNNNKRFRPDVIIHFPDKRDLIIDAKMSLTAYERFFNASTDDERELAANEHLKSVKNHVGELVKKDYSSLLTNGNSNIDFVLMFVPNEGALQLALSRDPMLWQDSYSKGVLIVSGQNLYALLRIVELAWKQDRQVKNQHEIIETANLIVERVQLLYERIETAQKKLNDTQEAFNDLRNISGDRGKSIAVAARKLIDYGAKENKKKKAIPLATPADDDIQNALPLPSTDEKDNTMI